MAKLAIYRGETFEREVELAPRGARIGRGDQNDIVLPDPAKSVSRFHAELRFENGRYTIVDLNSQNGTWVAGKRVPQAVLEAGVPVVLGTYRLLFIPGVLPPEAEMTMVSVPEPPLATTTAAPAEAVPTPAPPVDQPGHAAIDHAAPPAAPVPTLPAVPPAAPVLQTPESVTAPPPIAEPAVAAPPPLISHTEAAVDAVEKAAEPKIAAVAPPPPLAPAAPPPVAAAPPPAAPAPAAPAAPPPAPPLVSAPPKAAAPTQTMPAAKAAPPKPAVAASAKGAQPAKPTPPKPTGKGMSKGVLFGGLAVLVLAGAAAGLFLWPAAPAGPGGGAQQAQNAPATSAAAPAATPGTESAPGATPETPAPAVPPSGGAPSAAAPGETPSEPAAAAPTAAEAKVPAAQRAARPAPTSPAGARDRKAGAAASRRPDVKARPANLQQTFEQSRSAMSKGDYLAAIAGFESILKVDPKYPEAAELLGVARGGARNASQLAIDSGNKAEMGGDFVAAARHYERAQQLDPESGAPAEAMKRLRARMQSEGEDAFRRAKQFDALGRTSDAIAMYEKALQLLPADHASVKTARERLAALRGGH